MIFSKRFFKIVFFCVCSCVVSDGFGINANSCNSGGEYQYCAGSLAITKCKSCPGNCYCPSWSLGTGVACTARTDLRCNYNGNRKLEGKSGLWYEHEDGAFGVFLCPEDYPNSDNGASSIWDCYNHDNNGQRYTVTCEENRYLPANSTSCAACSAGYECSGGSFTGASNEDRGKKRCEPGTYSTQSSVMGCRKFEGNCFSNLPGVGTNCPNKCEQNGYAVDDKHTKCIKCSDSDSFPMEDHSACVSDCGTDKLLGTYIDNGVCKTCPDKTDDFEYVLPYRKTKATSITDCRIKTKNTVNPHNCESVTIYYHSDSSNQWVLDNGTVIKSNKNYYINNSISTSLDSICLSCGTGLYNSGVTFTYSSNKTSPDTKDQSCSPCQPGNCVDKGICITCKSGKICPTINLSCNDAQSCESKSYIPDESKTKCELCPAGSIANEGGNKCVTGPIVFSDSHGGWHWSSGISSVVLWNNVDMSALEGRQ